MTERFDRPGVDLVLTLGEFLSSYWRSSSIAKMIQLER